MTTFWQHFVYQHTQNQILIKMEGFIFYKNQALSGITLATLCPAMVAKTAQLEQNNTRHDILYTYNTSC